MGVARERDDAHRRMVVAQTRNGADSIQQRHVEVDDDCVRPQLLRELDRREAVESRSDHRELWLALDQGPQRLNKSFVVVGEENADRPTPRLVRSHQRKLALLGLPCNRSEKE